MLATSQEQAKSIDAALLAKLGLTADQQAKVRERMSLGWHGFYVGVADRLRAISGS